jgi:diguanylate cyclase (GGDEF)-like protein
MPAPNDRCVQESPVANDGQSSDPRACLPAAVAALTGGADLDHQLAGVLDAASSALRPAMGAVFIADPDRAGIVLAKSVGMDEAADARLEGEVSDPTHPFAAAARERVATFDRGATTPTGGSFLGAYLPLLVSTGGVEQSLGSIGFGWPAPHELSDEDRVTLVALAGLAAVAVDRARLASTAAERSEWFERMAHSDPLTGLANERTVARVLELELARAGRQGGEVAFAMFDVDDFQATNREGGPAAGDDVLRRVAAVLAESVRLVDTVGRIGGDEFVLIAPGSAGLTVANRVMAGIAALPAIAGRSVSISAGLARFPIDGADADSLIAAATAALARARSEGRGSIAETGVAAEG